MSSPGRPGMGPTAVVGLAGAGLAAVSSAQVWGRAEVTEPALRVVEARGADVAPVALPLALVALAAWGAVLVLRRRGRRVVSVVGLLAALGVLAAVALRVTAIAETARDLVAGGAARTDVSTQTTAWPWAAAIGAVFAAVAFAVALRALAGWPEMSSRYDAPTDGGAEGGAKDGVTGGAEGRATPDMWKALDEGRDPTT